MHHYIGKSIPRLDAIDKVTGRAVYNDDLKLYGMLYGKVLHSTEAHAMITGMDVTEASAVPGVVAVITGEDLDYLGGEALKDMPFLAKKRVRYCGEPVAAVAAISEDIAEYAVSRIKVDYEPLPPVLDIDSALEANVILHPDLEKYRHIEVVRTQANSNICNHYCIEHGDVERGFADAALVFEDEYFVHDVHHAQIEPFSSVAQVMRDGVISVWTANSSVHRLRKDLSDALRLPENRLRIIANYVGGSFGGKGGLKLEPIAVALAMRTSNMPVKLVYTREECFAATLSRHAVKVKIKTGVTKEGVLTAKKVELFYDTGAYSEKGPTVCVAGCDSAGGPYRIPNIEIDSYCIYTNKSLAGAYRGYGATQAVFATEVQMDKIAKALRIDPIEIRKRNILEEGEENSLGHKVYGVGLRECLEAVESAIKWNEKDDRATPPHIKRGRGVGVGWEPTKSPSGSGVYITMHFDSSVNISLSSSEVGQGSRTVLSQIAAEALSVPIEMIRLSFPDTDLAPFDASTTASRTTFHMGNAIVNAAKEIIDTLKEHASNLLSAPPHELVNDMGKIYRKNCPEKAVLYREVIKYAYGAGGSVNGKSFYYPAPQSGAGIFGSPSVYWMFGAQAADVTVNTLTGKIEIETIVAAQNVGKAINPMNVAQQIEGSLVQGIGNTLYENVIREDGKMVNANFHDYKIATAMDIPQNIVPIIVECPDPLGPYGAKGVGEPAIIPTSATITNAVSDAIGREIGFSLLKPENIMDLLDES